jgi:signal transduction histidine kinase
MPTSPHHPLLPDPPKTRTTLHTKLIIGFALLYGVLLVLAQVWSQSVIVTIGIVVLFIVFLYILLYFLFDKPFSHLLHTIRHNLRQHHQDFQETSNPINDLTNAFEISMRLIEKLHFDRRTDSSNAGLEKLKTEIILSTLPEGILVLNTHKQILIANTAAEKILGQSFKRIYTKHVDQVFFLQNANGDSYLSSDYFHPLNIDLSPIININTLTDISLVTQHGIHTIDFKLYRIDSTLQTELAYVIKFSPTKVDNNPTETSDAASIATHELRTPLTNIKSALAVFIDKNKTNLPQDQQELLGIIWASTQDLSALIDNLSNITKLESGTLSLNEISKNWNQFVTQVVDGYKIAAEQKGINLTLNLEEPSPTLSFDPVRIGEVIGNLLTNALHYTSSGGTIHITTHVDQSSVTFAIHDTGQGIPNEALPQLFNKFYRVTSAQDNIKGSGLGLYLSKSIIEMHHGTMWVESELGKGSTFYFSLPLSHG